MDPFEPEPSTPSPQNNGSGDSIQSDDFVKLDNNSLLFDLNQEVPADELSPGQGTGDDPDDVGEDNFGFEDSPTVESRDTPSANLVDFGEDKYETEDVREEALVPEEPEAKLGVDSDLLKVKKEVPEPFELRKKEIPVEDPVPVEKGVKKEEPVKPAKKSDESSCPFKPVAELLYWRDVKKSGVTFGSILLVLLSLTYLSLISVVAYLSLALLGVTMSFRIYKSVLTAVQKSNDGHPFKECLEKDCTLSAEKLSELSETVHKHLDCTVKKTKSLFLVEDIVDSIKFGLVLWVFTYIGAWFNGMTLLTLFFVAAFTLPKVYETNQKQIDLYIGIACKQIKDIMDKVKAKVPMLNKKKEE